jgi:hypothetical protein
MICSKVALPILIPRAHHVADGELKAPEGLVIVVAESRANNPCRRAARNWLLRRAMMPEIIKLFHSFQDFLDIISRLSGGDFAVKVIAAAITMQILRTRTVSVRRGRFSLFVVFSNSPSPPANGASLGAHQRAQGSGCLTR